MKLYCYLYVWISFFFKETQRFTTMSNHNYWMDYWFTVWFRRFQNLRICGVICVSSLAEVYKTCHEIRQNKRRVKHLKNIYAVDPDGAGGFPFFAVKCDFRKDTSVTEVGLKHFDFLLFLCVQVLYEFANQNHVDVIFWFFFSISMCNIEFYEAMKPIIGVANTRIFSWIFSMLTVIILKSLEQTLTLIATVA